MATCLHLPGPGAAMKHPWLCSFVVFGAAAAFGQSNTPQATPPMSNESAGTITVTGCVARADKTELVTLTHAMVLPSGSPTVAPPVVSAELFKPPRVNPAHLSANATQQQTTQPDAKPPATARSGVAGAVGTSGTTGLIVGTAPSGSSASSVDGYRLSGVDMTAWIGHRVQLIGFVIPAAPRTQSDAVERGEGIDFGAVPVFRVVGVQPATGPCPKR